MIKNKKKALLFIPLAILLALGVVYFLFPGVTFKALLKAERSIAGLEQRRIQVGDWHIEYLVGGQGDELVLLHGFGSNKDNWTRIGIILLPIFG